MNIYALSFKNFLLSCLIFIGFPVISYIIILGVPTVPINIPSGSFTIRQMFSSVTFMQKEAHTTYEISPFNDYFLYTDGSRHAVIPYETEAKTITVTSSTMNPVVSSVLSYFYHPALHFTVHGTTAVEYNVAVQNNTISMTRTIPDYPEKESVKYFGSTLKIERDDIVIDDTGKVYTELNITDQQSLNAMFSMNLVPVDSTNRHVEIIGKHIIVLNPHAQDILYITKESNQKIFFNKTFKLIETETPVDQTSSMVYTNDISIITPENIKHIGMIPSAFAQLTSGGLWK